jgi:hypothetical protein
MSVAFKKLFGNGSLPPEVTGDLRTMLLPDASGADVG